MDSSIQILRLPLIKRNDRPSFEFNNTLFLMDTGANIPVWCSGKALFNATYPDAVKVDYTTRINGFGKGARLAQVYKIPEFVLENEGVTYKILDLYVAVLDYSKIGFDFILSSTMFSKSDYTVSNSEHFLIISFRKEEFRCTPLVLNNEVDKITIWTQ